MSIVDTLILMSIEDLVISSILKIKDDVLVIIFYFNYWLVYPRTRLAPNQTLACINLRLLSLLKIWTLRLRSF